MGVFKELDPAIIRRVIQGYDDVLTPTAKADEAFYRQFSCPRCNGNMNKEFNARSAFDGESLLPKALLRCPLCTLLLEPHTNVIVEVGDDAVLPLEIDPTLKR
jgi:hypothetical protein